MGNSSTTNIGDWESLREKGLEHLQAMSGHLWTDFHIHDPGVTLLELLCYAITDLDARLSQDIANIVTENTTETTIEHFFSPGNILTINPVTINDYRKLLIDLPGVKNAWLSPVTEGESALYYDQDNNTLLYDYTSGSQRIVLNGLYRVYIEKDDVTDERALKSAVLEKLHQHRNLCEDFVEVNIMEEEIISVFSDIQIDENADANEVMAKIYYDLESFISPRVKQYSLKRMLQKGKTIEEIFTGPQLENGFIDNDEFGTGERCKELHTSDLIRIIMAHSEVKDVRNLFIANELNPDVRNKQEWALVVDSTKALVLESFNGTKLRLFKNDTLCPVSSATVKAKVALLKEEASREMFDDPAMDLNEDLDEVPDDLTEYRSIAYELPAIYGVSETGLPSTASVKRRTQTRQLRAYLLFFEQILVNYLKQLDSFKRLFAFRQHREEILKTYFSQLLPEEIWKADFPEIETMILSDPTETLPFCEAPFKRKNRILDHLLAQFNEKFADYALFGYKYNMLIALEPEEKETYYLKAKADFLENYPELSRNRNRASNYLMPDRGRGQTDGLKNLIASKLGISLSTDSSSDTDDSEEFFIVEHILFRPEGSWLLDFICSERIEAGYQPDPYSYQLTLVIPEKSGRFSNSKFKELVYHTIVNEISAHISYTVLEFNATQMKEFVKVYGNFLSELINHRQGKSAQYHFYRNQLMELLDIGRPRLPVLHLDAQDVSGTGAELDEDTFVQEWIDLSGNNHNASSETIGIAPCYLKTGMGVLPSIRFDEDSRLKIANALIADDFTIVVVFKTIAQTERKEDCFTLIYGVESIGSSFILGFQGNGNVMAGIGSETVNLESEAASPHLAMFIRNRTAGEIRLYLDGVLEIAQVITTNRSLAHEAVVIGPGVTCDVGEVIILDSVLTGSKKSKLEEYFSQKWGIPLSAVSSIAKPVLHLDANVSTSFIKDETTNKISTWNDLSQESIGVTQGSSALQPIYYLNGIGELSALYFNNSVLILPNTAQNLFKADFTIGIVYQADQGEGRLLDGTATATEKDKKSFFISLGAKGALNVQGEKEAVELAATFEDTHLAIILGRVAADKLDVTLWLDGKSFNDQAFGDAQVFSDCPTDLAIGRSRSGDFGFIGKIGEIIIFDKALSVWDRQRLEQFLADKWQIDISGVDNVVTPVLHLDAARQASVRDETGAVLDRDTTVYQWLDLGSNGNNAMQNNTNRRPKYAVEGINGLGAIKFTQAQSDESDFYEDSLNIDQIIQNDFTIMIVFKPDTSFYSEQDIPALLDQNTGWTEGVALIDADCSGLYNDFGLSFGKSGEKLIVMGGIGDRLTNDHTVKTGELDFNSTHFITFTREKANGEVKLYADGMLHAQADLRDNVRLNDSRNIKIGAFNSEGLTFHGLIGEIIIFNQLLTDKNRQRIEAYLATKWKISVVTLPIDTTGLSFHLDAAATASIAKDTNHRVSQWSDADGLNEIGAVQAVMEYQPVYTLESSSGWPSIRFNNSFMEIVPKMTSYGNLTLAIVYTAFSTGNLYPGWEEAGLVDHYMEGEANNFGMMITKNCTLGARIGMQRTEAAVSLNVLHIGLLSRNQVDGKVEIYLDGLLTATGDSDPQIALSELHELTIGAIRKCAGEQVSKGYFHGDIAEIILLNRVLSSIERQSLEEYFSRKWQIDISGINHIAKPVLHLDVGRLATVLDGDIGKVSQWLDRNGLDNYATQTDFAKQPEYRENVYNGQGVLRFDGVQKNCLTIKSVVEDDFTVIIVYKAENGDSSEYMPVARDSFTVIAGVDTRLSETIWTYFKNQGYIDDHGNVLSTFKPGEDDFILVLDTAVMETIQTEYYHRMKSILTEYSSSRKAVPEDAFTDIGGVDQTLSQTIWQQLEEEKNIDSDGKVLKTDYAPNSDDFINSIIESAVLHVVLTQNWLEGMGLFDGNCAGARNQLHKRDFGILIGKDGQLMAGIGVPDEQDYQLIQAGLFDQWHIGILTRVKDTGVTRLYLDDAVPKEKKIGRNVSLKDSKRFTIGAKNTGGNYFTGDIAEIIVLDTVPDDTQIAAIQSFLAKKWGVAMLDIDKRTVK